MSTSLHICTYMFQVHIIIYSIAYYFSVAFSMYVCIHLYMYYPITDSTEMLYYTKHRNHTIIRVGKNH